MKNIALVLCPSVEILPELGIASIYPCFKKGFKSVTFFDFNIDFYKCLSRFKRSLFKYLFISYSFFERRSSHPKYNYMRKMAYSISCRLGKRFIDRWAEEILRTSPDIVGFSCCSNNMLVSLRLAEKIKKANGKTAIIFGGPNCSFEESGEYIIKKEFVDFVVVGEGESTIKELLKSLKKGKKLKTIKGVICKSGGKVHYGGYRPFITNLDLLPFPDFSIFNLKEYPTKRLPLSFSRGCVNNCVFCNSPKLYGKYRNKSAGRILKELMRLKREHGIKHFSVVDDLINGNHLLLKHVSKKLIKKSLNIRWGGQCRVDERLTYLFLKDLRKAGCCSLIFGLESGSDKVLRDMNKGFDTKLAETVIRNAYNAGIIVNSFWIVGFPNETSSDFFETLKFIWKNRKYLNGEIKITMCRLLPGTKMYTGYKGYEIEDNSLMRTWKAKNLSWKTRAVRTLILFGLLSLINKKFNYIH